MKEEGTTAITEDQERIWQNTRDLEQELSWLDRVLSTRAALNRRDENNSKKSVYDNLPPVLQESISDYAQFVVKHGLGFDERLSLIMALAPHLKPKALDIFLRSDGQGSGFGGGRGKQHQGFLPTGETVLFVLAGENLQKRVLLNRIFGHEHVFWQQRVIWIESNQPHEPLLSGNLRVSDDFLDLFTTGTVTKPRYSNEFPAKLLETEMEWDDLILHTNTSARIREVEQWLHHKDELLANDALRKRLRPGFLALFYGPPGTGKSATAAVLGNHTNKDVFRIDLSGIVSKYIGETEKNLARIFDKAENKDWILFFDEADALFGKRSDTKDSHDRYANQEVAYLLQRIEDYRGLVILATNLRSNIDEAFSRRFKALVHFPMPSAGERELLWNKCLTSIGWMDESINLRNLAREHELSGGHIINVVEYCAIRALEEGRKTVGAEDLLSGISNEYRKLGKTF